MSGTFPKYELFQSDGITSVYTFDNVTDDENIFADPANFVEHNPIRGQGSIIVEGSDSPFDLTLEFVLLDDNYEALVAQINSLPTTIQKFTKYILKVELTSGGSTKDIKVMRLQNFELINNTRKKRVTFQRVRAIFRANTWV